MHINEEQKTTKCRQDPLVSSEVPCPNLSSLEGRSGRNEVRRCGTEIWQRVIDGGVARGPLRSGRSGEGLMTLELTCELQAESIMAEELCVLGSPESPNIKRSLACLRIPGLEHSAGVGVGVR